MHICQTCKDRVRIDVESNELPADWKDWYLWLVHDHSSEPVMWKMSVFKRVKGGRYPEGAKEIAQLQAENRRAIVAAKRVKKAERSNNKVVG